MPFADFLNSLSADKKQAILNALLACDDFVGTTAITDITKKINEKITDDANKLHTGITAGSPLLGAVASLTGTGHPADLTDAMKSDLVAMQANLKAAKKAIDDANAAITTLTTEIQNCITSAEAEAKLIAFKAAAL